MRDGRLAYLDFGMMGTIDLPVRNALVRDFTWGVGDALVRPGHTFSPNTAPLAHQPVLTTTLPE